MEGRSHQERRDDLLTRVRSRDPSVRAEAGYSLAAYAGDERIDRVLVSLVQDQDDTLPTLRTVEGLLDRHDEVGVRLLAVALTAADEDSTTHALDAMFSATSAREQYVELRDLCRVLVDRSDPSFRDGLHLLLRWFETYPLVGE